MSREKAGYRDQLEDILTYFEGRRLLSVTDVANYLGISRARVRRRYKINGQDGITATELARLLVI